jgi:arabinan endo-1,5-alpha-L-arabinosidase
VVLAVAGTLLGGTAGASTLAFRNPLRDARGRAISCPDPSVAVAPSGHWRYVLVCTSDYARNAFPIWVSQDLVRWRRHGWAFPHGHQPHWALPALGGHGGRYWSPTIYRIGGHWVLYFAARYDPASRAIPDAPFKVARGTMVLGVASAPSIHGPWRTKVLHWRGQFNALNGLAVREIGGGDIDPSVARDPTTKQYTLFWAEQPRGLWSGPLSPDGLTLSSAIAPVLGVTEPWECDPYGDECTIEGPEPFYANGALYLLYSAGSTWDASYAVGAAMSADPAASTFTKLGTPVLQSGGHFIGPGRTSQPVIGPDGNHYVLYHALTRPAVQHHSNARLLLLGRLNWAGLWPVINDGHP